MKREVHNVEEVTLRDTRDVPEDELQAMKKRSDDLRDEAIAGLQKAENGFAVFYITKSKGRSGVQALIAGEMNLNDTLELLNAMHETCESIMEGVAEQLHEITHEPKRGRRGKSKK